MTKTFGYLPVKRHGIRETTMYQTYYWFNKPGETIVLCLSCGGERSDSPTEEFNWEDSYPETPLQCSDCGELIGE